MIRKQLGFLTSVRLSSIIKTLLYLLLIFHNSISFALPEITVEEIKQSLDPLKHITKSFIPSWLSSSDQAYGFELTSKRMLLNMASDPMANLLWLFGSSSYDAVQFRMNREHKVNSLLPESGITPKNPILFDEQALHDLNPDITEQISPRIYETEYQNQGAELATFNRINTGESGIGYFYYHYANNHLQPEDVVNNFYRWLDHHAPWHVKDIVIKRNQTLAVNQAKSSAERWEHCRELYSGDIEKCRLAGIIKALDGIPVVVKDEISVPGYTTSYGLDPLRVDRHFPSHTRESQSEVVKRMTDEGAIVLGKSNQHIFGLGAFGLNPHYPRMGNIYNSAYIPGGSSSGSAMFVGIGGPLAIGTDGGGSVSIPAANTGIPGLKPTEGKITAKNYDDAAPGLVAIGLLGQSFFDLAEGYRVTSQKVPTSHVLEALSNLRIGVDPGWFQHASRDVATVTLTCLETLINNLQQREGLSPQLLAMHYLPEDYEKPLWDTHTVLFGRGEAEGKAGFIDKGIPAETELALIMGLSLDRSTIENAKENKKRLTHHFQNNIFSKVDVIVMPTLLTTAPKAERPWFQVFDNGELNLAKTYLMTAHTGLANLTGGPRVTVQCGFDENYLPIGLQLMGNNNSEYLLMLLGATVEKSILARDQDHPAWKLRPHFNPFKNSSPMAQN
ncbi:amidase [Endozoicomonas elysicola]|uniref:Amidase domain-containing protein n=1 Tax=Endozoicomonas elysicola TaxID=305900 RepID=A0A081KC25_9GAMM|nr:amidase [Endozoicomonas elysicola]KEI71701.1 hypothetical protein GV64_13995 [Endozoicomonas elysicola]